MVSQVAQNDLELAYKADADLESLILPSNGWD